MSKAGICFYSALSLSLYDFRSLTETHDLKNCRRSFLHTHIYRYNLRTIYYLYFFRRQNINSIISYYLSDHIIEIQCFLGGWTDVGIIIRKKIVFFHLQSIFHFIRLRGLIWRQNSKEIFFWGAQQRMRRRRRIFFFFLLFTRGHTVIVRVSDPVGNCESVSWPAQIFP